MWVIYLWPLFHWIRQGGKFVKRFNLFNQFFEVRPETTTKGLEQKSEPNGQGLWLELWAKMPKEEVTDFAI